MRQPKLLWLIILLLCQTTLASDSLTTSETKTIKMFEKISPLVVNGHRITRVINTQFILHDRQTGTGSGFLWSK